MEVRAQNLELDLGAAVRLERLQGAAHLNGHFARVLRFVPDKGRVEVALLQTGDVKSVQALNLTRLPVLEEVAVWRDHIARADMAPAETLPAIYRLRVMPVDVEVLQKTRAGKAVNEMVKRHAEHEDVSAQGKQLVKKWRDMYQREKAKSEVSAQGSDASGATAKVAKTVSRKDEDDTRGAATSSGSHTLESQASTSLPSRSQTSKDARDLFSWSARNAPVPKSNTVADVEPILCLDDSARFLKVMHAAGSERARLAALAALDRTDSELLTGFLGAGGLSVLDTWIRAYADCRSAGLAVLAKLPVTSRDIREVRITGAMMTVIRSDANPENRQQAQVLLDKWRADNIFPNGNQEATTSRSVTSNTSRSPGVLAAAATVDGARQAQENVASAPEVKRQRLAATPSPERQSEPASGPPVQSAATRKPDVSEQPQKPIRQEPAQHQQQQRRPSQMVQKPLPRVSERLAATLPPELASLDPRIAAAIHDNPQIMDFLSKHKSVYQNLNAENVKFLVRNLENSRVQVDDADEEETEATSRTVTVSNLSPEATEQDVYDLLDGCTLSPESVTLPRESRRQRSCGVAYVVLPSREAAWRTVRDLQNHSIRGRAVQVELADSIYCSPARRRGEDGLAQPGCDGQRRVVWMQDENLWEVALFDKSESVVDFRTRLSSANESPVTQLGQLHADHGKFQDAAKREHAEERKLVRQALASQS